MPSMMTDAPSGLFGGRAGGQVNLGGWTARGGAGASVGSSVPPAQTAPGGYYGAGTSASAQMAGAPAALLVLVLIEAGLLVVLRSAFKRHHGG